MVEAQRTARCLNDYVLPAPGSFVGSVIAPNDMSEYVVWTVVAAKEVVYPSNWRQYFLTLVGRERILNLDVECSEFHNNWHVYLRPGLF